MGDAERDQSIEAVSSYLEVAASGSTAGADRVRVTGEVDAVVARPGERDPLIAALGRDPAIRMAEADQPVATPASTVAPVPDDPLFELQWGLQNTGQTFTGGSAGSEGQAGIDVRALPAWSTTRGSSDVVVAVIDTVVDADHSDLRGAVTAQFRAPSLEDASQPGQHGTGVASVIAARTDDGFGIAGVAPRVSVVDIAAFTSEGAEPGSARISGIIAAIEQAVQADADVINASWVTPDGSALLRDVIADSGIVMVAATGNDGQTLTTARSVFPAGYDLPNVIAVTAISADGSVPDFANTGATVVDIAAPGDGIAAALPGDVHGAFQGTSFAAPHVTGAIALAQTVAPYATPAELIDAVTWTSRALPSLVETTRSGGMLDVDALVRGIQRPVCRPDALPDSGFSDVATTSAHASGIACLAVEGIATGHTDGTYAPRDPVTRAQLSSLLGRILLDAGVSPTTAPPAFEDVDQNSIHAPAIALLSSLDIVRGDADGRFRPNDPVTRGQMASLLVRTHRSLTGISPEPTRSWFDDTAASLHGTNIDVGRDLGILRGVGGRDYAPSAATRRDQIASFLARTLDAVARAAPASGEE